MNEDVKLYTMIRQQRAWLGRLIYAFLAVFA